MPVQKKSGNLWNAPRIFFHLFSYFLLQFTCDVISMSEEQCVLQKISKDKVKVRVKFTFYFKKTWLSVLVALPTKQHKQLVSQNPK